MPLRASIFKREERSLRVVFCRYESVLGASPSREHLPPAATVLAGHRHQHHQHSCALLSSASFISLHSLFPRLRRVQHDLHLSDMSYVVFARLSHRLGHGKRRVQTAVIRIVPRSLPSEPYADPGVVRSLLLELEVAPHALAKHAANGENKYRYRYDPLDCFHVADADHLRMESFARQVYATTAPTD